MKKPTLPKRAVTCSQSDTPRIPGDETNGDSRRGTAFRGVSQDRTTTSSNRGRCPALVLVTNPATPRPTVPLSRKPGSAELLGLFGHKPSCAELSKAGLVASCDCTPAPMQDPAVAIGVVMHYARLGTAQRAPLPPLIVELLMHHVKAGDPACVMVADWLDRSGRLNPPTPAIFRRRIRS